MDVNQIFKDLATMVHEQGEVIDSIEANVESSHMNVGQGVQQLAKASDYQVTSPPPPDGNTVPPPTAPAPSTNIPAAENVSQHCATEAIWHIPKDSESYLYFYILFYLSHLINIVKLMSFNSMVQL